MTPAHMCFGRQRTGRILLQEFTDAEAAQGSPVESVIQLTRDTGGAPLILATGRLPPIVEALTAVPDDGDLSWMADPFGRADQFNVVELGAGAWGGTYLVYGEGVPIVLKLYSPRDDSRSAPHNAAWPGINWRMAVNGIAGATIASCDGHAGQVYALMTDYAVVKETRSLTAYTLMEFVPAPRPGITDRLEAFVLKVANALAALEEQLVCHNDVSVSNVFPHTAVDRYGDTYTKVAIGDWDMVTRSVPGDLMTTTTVPATTGAGRDMAFFLNRLYEALMLESLPEYLRVPFQSQGEWRPGMTAEEVLGRAPEGPEEKADADAVEFLNLLFTMVPLSSTPHEFNDDGELVPQKYLMFAPFASARFADTPVPRYRPQYWVAVPECTAATVLGVAQLGIGVSAVGKMWADMIARGIILQRSPVPFHTPAMRPDLVPVDSYPLIVKALSDLEHVYPTTAVGTAVVRPPVEFVLSAAGQVKGRATIMAPGLPPPQRVSAIPEDAECAAKDMCAFNAQRRSTSLYARDSPDDGLDILTEMAMDDSYSS